MLLKKFARAQKLKQQMAKATTSTTTDTSSDPSTTIPQFDGLGDVCYIIIITL